MRHIDLSLTPEEIRYLQGLIREPLEYYRALAGSEKCSPKNRERYEFLRRIMDKLACRIV